MSEASHRLTDSERARLRLPGALLAMVIVVTIWSAIGPKDGPTWWLEAVPVLIAMPLLLWMFRKFPLTPLSYILVAVHSIILLIGAHYTYAEVPLGFWMQETFGFARNHYDRIGHVAQGFIPAILAREILLRESPLGGADFKPASRWLPFLVVCFCLAFSAFYELIEWWTALIAGGGDIAFLGTQGDPWDAQWDMCLALIGAIVSLLTLSSLHDRQLSMLAGEP